MPRFAASLLLLCALAGVAMSQDSCDKGWSGVNCAICTDDAACAASTGDPEATCSTELPFQPNSELKNYACTVTSDTAKMLVVPDSILLQCDLGSANVTTVAAARKMLSPDQEAGCDLFLTIAPSYGGLQIKCTTSECGIEVGQTGVTCQTASCECLVDPECGNPTIKSVVDGIQGPAGLTCQDGGDCSIEVSNLPIGSGGIAATCTSAECLPGAEE